MTDQEVPEAFNKSEEEDNEEEPTFNDHKNDLPEIIKLTESKYIEEEIDEANEETSKVK